MKAAVYQMPYVQGSALFVMACINQAGYLDPGNMGYRSAYLYLVIILTVSFFAGIWGLFMFMDITKKYELLVDYMYRSKSVLLKLIVVFVNVQGILIDILAQYEVINCIPPYISSSAMGAVYKSILSLTESLILGTICYRLYTRDTSHL